MSVIQTYYYRGYYFRIAGLLRGLYEGAGIEKGFVYEIDDLKPAMQRPYLRSVDECKKYIDHHVNGFRQCSLSDYGGGVKWAQKLNESARR